MTLLETLEAIGSPRIMVCGDSCTDILLHVRTTRPDPAGHGMVRYVKQTVESDGMSGAVASLCETLGADVTLYGGNCGSKTRLAEDGKMLPDRIDRERRPRMRHFPFPEGVQAVLVCDHGKGSITQNLFSNLVDQCQRRHIPVLVDPAPGVDWGRYGGAALIKANRHECGNHSDEWHGNLLVTTDGACGLGWTNYQQTGGKSIAAIPHTAIVDTTGCGDTVFAVLGCCVASGIELPDACKLANVAAGLQTQRLGVQPITRTELQGEIARLAREDHHAASPA